MYFREKFYRIPLDFDYLRLQKEINAVDESHWSPHPQAFKGNDALILLSSGGTINDLNYGPMQFTPCMAQLPYLKQVLESFNTVIGRTRLMRLAPGEKVGRHSDVSLYWWHRFRIHVPIITHPDVSFYCEDTHVHMQAGEAWTFDNWRYHEVHNNSDITRVHLVIDTVGSPELWNMLEQHSWHPKPGETHTPKHFKTRFIPYQENREAHFDTENYNIVGVLSPAELDAIVDFVWKDMDRSKLDEKTVAKVQNCLIYLKRAWRAFHSVHGGEASAYKNYSQLLSEVVSTLQTIEPQAVLASNGFALSNILNTQISLTMQDVLREQASTPAKISEPLFPGALKHSLEYTPELGLPGSTQPGAQVSDNQSNVDCIFLVSAPKAGGELIEGMLSASRLLHTLEPSSKKGFIQAILNNPQSARLNLKKELFANQQLASPLKLLYHHPEIIEHLPSLLAAFPNSKIIFSYREPGENLAALAKDWENEYFFNPSASQLTGAKWYHTLPDNWQESSLNSLEDKLCLQYTYINQNLMQLLEPIAPSKILCINFDQLFDNNAVSIQALCAFCEIPYGPRLQQLDMQALQTPRNRLDNLNDEQWSKLQACYQQLQRWQQNYKSSL